MKHLAPAFALCLTATPVAAQDGTGSITGTLDFDPARWVVASAGDGPTSGWSEDAAGTDIRLVGTPEALGEGGPGTLTIEMDVQAGAIEARAQDVRIELQRGDGTLVATSENIDLSLTAFQAEGEDLAIAGNIVATLTPDPTADVVIDADAAVTLDGNFQATIRDAGGTPTE
ncbi:MAG: hypothetical protein AAFY80_16785 [Pseudomonadota bacterium]